MQAFHDLTRSRPNFSDKSRSLNSQTIVTLYIITERIMNKKYLKNKIRQVHESTYVYVNINN